MSFRHTYIRNGGFTTDNQGRGLFRVRGSGGAGGTVDTVARALATAAQVAINKIVPNAGEVIQPEPIGPRVMGPDGRIYENVTGGPITLTGDTVATLTADGMTEVTSGATDTGTNIPVPTAAFPGDPEAPTIPELQTWITANVGPGLTFPINQTTNDVYLYVSALGKQFTWNVGDAEAGTDALSLAAYFDPNATSGGYEYVAQATQAPLTPSANADTLRHYEITATTPTEIANDGTNDYTVVRFTVPDSTPTSEPMRIDRNSAVHISLFGKVNSAVDEHFIINEDLRGVWLKPAAGGLWTASF